MLSLRDTPRLHRHKKQAARSQDTFCHCVTHVVISHTHTQGAKGATRMLSLCDTTGDIQARGTKEARHMMSLCDTFGGKQTCYDCVTQLVTSQTNKRGSKIHVVAVCDTSCDIMHTGNKEQKEDTCCRSVTHLVALHTQGTKGARDMLLLCDTS